MAKITGFLQKVFGKDASNIGQVGSAALGTKLITSDPDTIQALSAFENGIDDVALTSKRIIPQEEFMALHYLHTLQNAYQQQEGIQEYNSDVTYYQYSIVKKSGTYELYGSLVNDNVGNALTDGTKWILLLDLYSQGIVYGSNYILFPDGTLVQWGTSTNAGTSTTVTLPTAYANVNYNVYLTAYQSTDAAVGPVVHTYQTRLVGSFKWTAEKPSGTIVSTAGSVASSWLTIGEAP